MAIDAVIFDIGNVLLEWNPERYYDARIGPERRRALFAETEIEAMNLRLDLGEDFRETVYAHAAAHPEWAGEIRQWHDDWASIAGPEIAASVALLRALRSKGVPCHALSNFGVGSFAVARTVWPALDEFDRHFISGEMKTTKPDPAIYAAVETALAMPPETLLFTDDKAENVEAAAARGWQTHLFDGPDGFGGRLVAEGLLAEGEGR